jgi:hypothetical protein
MVVYRKLLQNCVLRKIEKDQQMQNQILLDHVLPIEPILQTVPGTVRVFYGESSFIYL